MPSTTPDLMTVTPALGGGSSRGIGGGAGRSGAAAPALPSAKPARAARRCAISSEGRGGGRSARGQVSSKLAGGASAASGKSGWSADSPGCWARSFRTFDENIRLRRRDGGGVGSAISGGATAGSGRIRSRGSGWSRQGGADPPGSGVSASPARSRGGASPSSAVAGRLRASPAIRGPSLRPRLRNSYTTRVWASTIIPLHAPKAPARIRVLPKLSSSMNPYAIARAPATMATIPATKRPIIIPIPLAPRLDLAQNRPATISSYCAWGQWPNVPPVPIKKERPDGYSHSLQQGASSHAQAYQKTGITALHQEFGHNGQLRAAASRAIWMLGIAAQSAGLGSIGMSGHQ